MLKLDIIFKKASTENEDMLQSFLASCLDIPVNSITNIRIAKNELVSETVDGKFSRLDLTIELNGSLVNVEIQLKDEKDFRDRTLYYWAKLYTSELKSGEFYIRLKRTITINITNFRLFNDEKYCREIITADKENGEIFNKKFSMHFIELPKIDWIINPNDEKRLWFQFLKAETEEELAMIEQTNVPIIKKAVNVIYDMSEDARVCEMV